MADVVNRGWVRPIPEGDLVRAVASLGGRATAFVFGTRPDRRIGTLGRLRRAISALAEPSSAGKKPLLPLLSAR
jgi:hypothetical protein